MIGALSLLNQVSPFLRNPINISLFLWINWVFVHLKNSKLLLSFSYFELHVHALVADFGNRFKQIFDFVD